MQDEAFLYVWEFSANEICSLAGFLTARLHFVDDGLAGGPPASARPARRAARSFASTARPTDARATSASPRSSR